MKEFETEILGKDNIYYFSKMLLGCIPVDINFDTTAKYHLFVLGLLFAAGRMINSVDKTKLTIGENKSFSKMLLYWTEHSLHPKLENKEEDDKAFLICSVRNADEKLVIDLQEKVNILEEQGYKVYYPRRDTNQIDDVGYNICLENANAISNSKTIFINYKRDSVGTLFDLGVAYYYQMKNPDRKFIVLNEKEFEIDLNDFGDRVIASIKGINDLYKEHNKEIYKVREDN